MKKMPKFVGCFCILCFLMCISFLLFALLKVSDSQSMPRPDRPVFHDADYQTNLSLSGRSTWRNVPYHVFDKKNIFSIKTETVFPQTDSYKEFLTHAKGIAASYLNTSVAKFEYGQYRLVGDGIEFQVCFNNDHSLDFRKVSLFFPFNITKIIFDYDAGGSTEIVHIIMPLKGNIKAITIFVDNIVNNIYPVDNRITLTVIYFQDKAKNKVRSLLRTKFATIPNFNWTFVSTKYSSFSRGKGLMIGADSHKPSDLLFFCDVDINMRPNFFRRCRTNSIQGRQVYYPIVYSLYNPDLVYGNQTQEARPILKILPDSGFWRSFGYGMVCLHKKDLDSVGGIPDLKSWGNEDMRLFQKISASDSIEYVRAPDPDLLHIYHHKKCDNMPFMSKKACIKSKIFVEGTQLQLGLALFKLSENVDIRSVLNKDEPKTLYQINSNHMLLLVSILFCLSLAFNLIALLWIILTSKSRCSRVKE